ncbi:MAG: aminomethyltransferase beta-barrel domain-containing protein, partial [Nitrospiria bacterium]
VKDQTYFLYKLKQEQMKFILFPLADMDKKEIYRIAKQLDFPYEDVLESQEVCFVNQGDYRSFLREERGISGTKGDYVSTEGEILGEHQGIPFYTIGQRKGLGVALGKRQFVVQMNTSTNKIILGNETDLLKKEMTVSELNWISGESLSEPLNVTVKIRYKSNEAIATIKPVDKSRVRILFDDPQKGVAPGQSAVFYLDDCVLGGGLID